MSDLLSNLEHWSTISDEQRDQVARDVSAHLDYRFEYVSLDRHVLGNQQHTTARFRWKDIYFRLIPGGEILLGYDRTRPHELNLEAQLSWQDTCKEYDLDPDFNDYLDKVTTPLRNVNIPPFLIAEKTTDVSYRKYSDETVEIPRYIQSLHPELPKASRSYVEVELSLNEIVDKLAENGFRLPTSDEWEFACSAGSRTLFRWGSECPLDCYPDETPSRQSEQTAWRIYLHNSDMISIEDANWLYSKVRTSDFDLHIRPNAFGLSIANSPSQQEMCAGGEMRGGDGGRAACGGMGFLIGWVPLSSPYIETCGSATAKFVRPTLSIAIS